MVRVPVEVELVLALGVAKRKRNRFARVEELARALRLAADRRARRHDARPGWAFLRQAPWGAWLRDRR